LLKNAEQEYFLHLSGQDIHVLSQFSFVCLFLKTALFGLKQVLSNFYAIGFL
jgi:hypothetical protein